MIPAAGHFDHERPRHAGQIAPAPHRPSIKMFYVETPIPTGQSKSGGEIDRSGSLNKSAAGRA
jgi:hypothetical protein